MALLSRDDSALIVIDPQTRLMAVMPEAESMLSRTRFLIRVAGLVGMPIVFTRQNPAGLGDLDAEVRAAMDAHAGDGRVVGVDKMTFDCFAEGSFAEAVAATGARTLLISGAESHICVCQTALSALGRGLAVQVAADACTSRVTSAHDIAMARMSAAGAEVTCAESAAYELVGRAGTDEFRALLAIVKG